MEEISKPNRENKEEKLIFLREINNLLDNFSEEIPVEMIDGSQEQRNYKVRTNWFTGIIHILEYAITRGILGTEFLPEIEQFIKNFKSRRIEPSEIKTTSEEIDTGNNLLKKVKDYIEKT
jgi:hypothetical protein